MACTIILKVSADGLDELEMKKLKEKIFSIVILIGLLVIFIPILLKESKEDKRVGKPLPELDIENEIEIAVSAAQLNPPPEEDIEIFSAKGTWVVQLEMFALPEQAEELMKKLKHEGYPAYTRPFHKDGKDFTIVLVGPLIRREDASKLIVTLEAKYHIKGIIIHYEPNQ